jgi:peptidoglycan-N-acetylglucosamine deacetylase
VDNRLAGWKGIGADAVVARCLAAAEPRAIILLHVDAASDDAAALPDLIAGLGARGYGFATVAEIAG